MKKKLNNSSLVSRMTPKRSNRGDPFENKRKLYESKLIYKSRPRSSMARSGKAKKSELQQSCGQVKNIYLNRMFTEE